MHLVVILVIGLGICMCNAMPLLSVAIRRAMLDTTCVNIRSMAPHEKLEWVSFKAAVPLGLAFRGFSSPFNLMVRYRDEHLAR